MRRFRKIPYWMVGSFIFSTIGVVGCHSSKGVSVDKNQQVPSTIPPVTSGTTTSNTNPAGTVVKSDGGGMGTPSGILTAGTSTTLISGGGTAGLAPLAAGCTPASANECPSVSGTCATTATAQVTNATFDQICLFGNTDSGYSQTPAATIEYIHENANHQTYYRFRVTFPTSFVDSTYGTGSVGWGKRGHRWRDLVGSDHTELQLLDKNQQLVLHFKMDFISLDPTQPSGYGTLGVKGGDGSMIVGDAAHILAVATSLSRNLNGCGYVKNPACGGDCLVNSPSTDARYTPNADAPYWDFRAQYEVWVDAAAFGITGFGSANISYVHASPAKSENDTIVVTPGPCPPPCPPGSEAYITAEGSTECIPITTTTKKPCQPGSTEYVTSEGAPDCTPIPDLEDYACPPGYVMYVTRDEDMVCVPLPDKNGICPKGYTLITDGEGKRCI